ncbi:MAG: hypothetical protein II347_05715, partial [Lachnospiraceae bacterium]|nr:hypothetical protein [Lachnospiraceae bacterium]
FARIIEWEFPGFSVDVCLPQLMEAQRQIEDNGFVEGRIHRFMMMARRPVVEKSVDDNVSVSKC